MRRDPAFDMILADLMMPQAERPRPGPDRRRALARVAGHHHDAATRRSAPPSRPRARAPRATSPSRSRPKNSNRRSSGSPSSMRRSSPPPGRRQTPLPKAKEIIDVDMPFDARGGGRGHVARST
ncbi:MAG: hypothetical protein MZV70_15925 [Desulfobacterales bacterium]|nr:hypothetical protein [Desulfobacterales bacterium]